MQDLSALIREIQELYLFGGLDTLRDDKEQEKDKQKALQVAEMLQMLVTMSPMGAEQNGVSEKKEDEAKNG